MGFRVWGCLAQFEPHEGHIVAPPATGTGLAGLRGLREKSPEFGYFLLRWRQGLHRMLQLPNSGTALKTGRGGNA